MNIWVIFWAFEDGSDSGVFPHAYDHFAVANHVKDLVTEGEKNSQVKRIYKLDRLTLNSINTAKQTPLPTPTRDILIDEANIIPMKTVNNLKQQKILTLQQLASMTEHQLLKLPNFGPKSLKEVVQELNNWNLKLADH